MENEKRPEKFILFLHDRSRLKKESDDPIKALIYFHPETEMDMNKKCWISNSILSLSQSISSLINGEVQNLHLSNFLFTVKSFQSLSISLGCTEKTMSGEELRNHLDLLLQIINFRFSSLENLLPKNSVDRMEFNLYGIFTRVLNVEGEKWGFVKNARACLLAEHCTGMVECFGACVLKDNCVLFTNFNTLLTKKLIATSYSFEDEVKVFTKVFLTAKEFQVAQNLKKYKSKKFNLNSYLSDAKSSSCSEKQHSSPTDDKTMVSVSLVIIRESDHIFMILSSSYITDDEDKKNFDEIEKYFFRFCKFSSQE